jgi:hypothetical protein
MSYLTRSFLLFILCFHLQLWAQPSKIINNSDSYNAMFGASWVILDDDGIGTNPFNFGQYHSLLYPTRAFFDKYLYQGWSVEGAGSTFTIRLPLLRSQENRRSSALEANK